MIEISLINLQLIGLTICVITALLSWMSRDKGMYIMLALLSLICICQAYIFDYTMIMWIWIIYSILNFIYMIWYFFDTRNN